ncbi:MAG: hypothetical protein ACXVLQ_16380 [Bacteriovorax sp.]
MKYVLVLLFQVVNYAFAGQLEDYMALPANPLTVNETLNDKNQVTTLVKSIDGGSIELTNENGDHFKLTIPAKALLVDTKITLVEVKKIESAELNFNENIWAVKILPAGLQFYKATTLAITPKTTVPTEDIVPFAYNGNGEEFRLNDFTALGSTTTLSLSQAGSFGLSKSTLNNFSGGNLAIQKILNFPPLKLNDRLISKIAAIKAQIIATGEGDGGAEMNALIHEIQKYFDDYVRPKLGNLSSCLEASALSSVFGSIERSLALMDVELKTPENFEANLSGSTLHNCNIDKYNACVNEHKVMNFVDFIFQTKRMTEILGGDHNSPGEIEQRVLADKCLQFDLEINSYLETRKVMGIQIRVKGKQHVYGSPDSTKTSDPGKIEITNLTWFADPNIVHCELKNVITIPSTDMKVDDFSILPSNEVFPGGNNVKLEYVPGRPLNEFDTSCYATYDPNRAVTNTHYERGSNWAGMFHVFHSTFNTKNPSQWEYQDERTNYRVSNWNVLGTEIFAKKTYQGTAQNELWGEFTELVLRHAPAK